MNMATRPTLLKEPDGLRYHGAAVLYALSAYVIGLAGLFQDSLIVNAGATLLLAHAMTIAAYMIHECAHNTVFRRIQHNAKFGRVLSWFCGAAYGTYEDIRYKHFRHHVDNDDVVWFDYDLFFHRHPRFTKLVQVLEWFYIPAHDLVMHFVMVFTSFIIPERRDQRVRNLAVIVVRGGLFGLALVYFPKVALLYVVAYLIMMQVLRFMDMLQHDYPYNLTLFDYTDSPHKGDFDWEQEHTFSNPLSLRFEKLNWLTLNFGYHNAHHSDMHAPWYRLPELHRDLMIDGRNWVIPLAAQLRLFHNNRVSRVYSEQTEGYPKGAAYLAAARAGSGPIGGNAASFLTSF
jgi:fatty acid desaturase